MLGKAIKRPWGDLRALGAKTGNEMNKSITKWSALSSAQINFNDLGMAAYARVRKYNERELISAGLCSSCWTI